MLVWIFTPLPSITQALLKISHISWAAYGIGLFIFYFIIITLRFLILSSLFCKKTLLTLINNLPLIGTIKKKLYWSKCTLLGGFLLDAGIPLLNSLQYIAKTLTDPHQLEELYLIIFNIKNGMSFSNSLAQDALFTPTTIQLIKIGEETGHLSKMLYEAALLLNQEINSSLETCNTLIQPVMTLIIGSLIASLLLTSYWPIFALNQFI